MKIVITSRYYYHMDKLIKVTGLDPAHIFNSTMAIVSNKPIVFKNCACEKVVLDKNLITEALGISNISSDITLYLISETLMYPLKDATNPWFACIPHPLRDINFDIITGYNELIDARNSISEIYDGTASNIVVNGKTVASISPYDDFIYKELFPAELAKLIKSIEE